MKEIIRLMEEFLLCHESNLLRTLTVSVLLAGLIKSQAVKKDYGRKIKRGGEI